MKPNVTEITKVFQMALRRDAIISETAYNGRPRRMVSPVGLPFHIIDMTHIRVADRYREQPFIVCRRLDWPHRRYEFRRNLVGGKRWNIGLIEVVSFDGMYLAYKMEYLRGDQGQFAEDWIECILRS